MTLIQTKKKIARFPIILVEPAFGQDWLTDKTVLIENEQTVSPDDLKLIKIVDTEDEVVEVLDNFYKIQFETIF
jgi:predicted Rossmann-fold nucleotide-binding protein